MNQHDRKTADIKAKAMERYDQSSRTLPPLHVGDHVLVQDRNSKRWDRAGVITRAGNSRDYEIKMPSGRLVWRNRRFLRKMKVPSPDELQGEEEISLEKKMPTSSSPNNQGLKGIRKLDNTKKEDGPAEKQLRRSKRVKIAPKRYPK